MSAHLHSCPFCDGLRRHAYSLNDYRVILCENCGTLGVDPLPSDHELEQYYSGFSFQTDRHKLKLIQTPEVFNWISEIMGPKPGSMLDIGGGGGFFCRVFEENGFGKSTYIDLDDKACLFAKKEMNLERVINDSVENIERHTNGQLYDFIYCRHVIEHLKNPVLLIRNAAELLKPGGTLVLQCPNARSKEALLYPKYWLKFLRLLYRSNSWSKLKCFLISLTPYYGWGLDPIRHLWAITGSGVEALFQNDKRFEVTTFTAALNDPVYSPYWSAQGRWEKSISKTVGKWAYRILGGAHLVVIIRRSK